MDKAHKWTDQQLADLEERITQVFQAAADDMQGKVTDYFAKFAKRDEAQKELVGTIVDGAEYTEADYQQWRLTQIGRGERFEAMRDKLAERVTAANEIAMSYASGDMAAVYAHNYAYTINGLSKMIEADEAFSGILEGVDWTLWDEDTVKRLVVEQPDIMPYYSKSKAVKRGFDLEYGKAKITQEVTSGIIQGKSCDAIAKSLMTKIPDMGRVSAIRAARTAITEAENAGRQAGAEQLEEKGVILNKRWIATNDDRTRDAHMEANGQIVGNDEPFVVGGEELMFPGDDSLGASGWNLYNCRCTRVTEVAGFKSILSADKLGKIKVTAS
jgi:uncharacterized protein with gpF-like domain